MTPFEQLIAIYTKHPKMCFVDDLALHMAHNGHIVAGTDFVAMIRPVGKDWPREWLADITKTLPPDLADCWFIWLLCGSLKEAVKHIPYPLPWFGFSQRGESARFVDAEKVLAKIR
jgi:hypothetical protein